MLGRFSTSITLTEEERARVENLKRKGYSIVGIFRRGLEASEKQPAEKGDSLGKAPKEIESKSFKNFKKEEEGLSQKSPIDKYGCGCQKVAGKFLCEKHGRV